MKKRPFYGHSGNRPYFVLPSHVLYGMRHALPKILYAMDMSDPEEERFAVSMLDQWPELCIEDALELLSSSIHQEAVRRYAVEQLDR